MNPGAVLRSAAFALLQGCRACDAGSGQAPAASTSGSDAGACSRPESEIAGQYRDLCLSREEVEAFAETVRAAVRGHDRARIASLIRYPFRAHTANCLRLLAGPADLVAHYDEIFTPTLVADVAAERPPYFVRDASVMLARSGRLWAWIADDHRLLLGGVFLGAGELSGVPCADRIHERLPENVWGTWRLSSIRSGPLEQLVSYRWDNWRSYSIRIDRDARTLHSTLGSDNRVCDRLMLSREVPQVSGQPKAPADVTPCSAFETFWGPPERDGVRLLQASCPGGNLVNTLPGTAVPASLILADENLMVLRLGCEGIAVLKKRGPGALAARPRVVSRGQACGSPELECAAGTQCVAISAHPLIERCKGVDEPAE